MPLNTLILSAFSSLFNYFPSHSPRHTENEGPADFRAGYQCRKRPRIPKHQWWILEQATEANSHLAPSEWSHAGSTAKGLSIHFFTSGGWLKAQWLGSTILLPPHHVEALETWGLSVISHAPFISTPHSLFSGMGQLHQKTILIWNGILNSLYLYVGKLCIPCTRESVSPPWCCYRMWYKVFNGLE